MTPDPEPSACPSPCSAPQAGPVTVEYRTVDATATAGRDYTGLPSTTLTFAPGETTVFIDVEVAGDTLRELAEYFTIRLANPTGAVLADATSRVTILDEEGPLTLTVGDTSVVEGDAGATDITFTLTLDEAPAAGETVTVRAASADGSASEGADYTRLSPTNVTFAAGESTKAVTVSVIGDVDDELDEYLLLNVNRPTNVRLADSQGRGLIIDDDVGGG